MWHMYIYVLKHPLRQDLFMQTYRNVVLKRLYLDFSVIWCTYATLDTCGNKFMKLIIVWNISNLFKYIEDEVSIIH